MRVRLLGEDLVAFRDTNGRVGLLAANCPDRGASLFFGRNEALDPGLQGSPWGEVTERGGAPLCAFARRLLARRAG